MKTRQWLTGGVGVLLVLLVLAVGATRVLPKPQRESPWEPVPTVTTQKGLTDRAIAQLSKDLHVASGDVQLVGVEPATWVDASLGCPDPATSYIQVITPGYRIHLAVAGVPYTVHTTERADSPLVRCGSK